MTDDRRGRKTAGSVEPWEPSVVGLEAGMYESDADAGHVWVRRDNAGDTVRARYEGYPESFRFEYGDETGIEQVDGAWRTLPAVAHTVRLRSRIEYWTKNRITGRFRFLTEMSLSKDEGEAGGARS